MPDSEPQLPAGAESGAPGSGDAGSGARKRKHRRVTTEPPAGSDPAPAAEPPRHDEHENDDRLKADKPPHWG